MALIVEDGTVVASAESYCSVSAADAYWLARGNPSSWSAATTTAKEVALRLATEYLDAVYGPRWLGDRFDDDQVLDWPREDVEVDGVSLEETPLPTNLIKATAELAYRQLIETGGILPDVADTGTITSQSVSAGAVSKSTSWANGKGKFKRFSKVEELLKRLLIPGTQAIRS